MITGLLIAALLLTALLAVCLPFGGWSSGMDAAGKGMALFFPFIFMVLRIGCFAAAIIVLANRGAFGWSGLPALPAGGIALLLLAGMGGSSFAAASLLGEAPRTYGRGSYAFLAVIVAPVVLAIWLFAEIYGADPAQLWVTRGLVVLAALGPLPLLLAIRRHDAEMEAWADAREKAEDKAARDYAGQLAPDASLLQALEFYDAIPDDKWKARGLVFERAKAMPDWNEAFMRVLASGSWDEKVRVAFHATALSPATPPEYFAAAQPIVEAVVRHLEDKSRGVEELARETAAGVRIAWPAIHTTHLPKALMERFLVAVETRANDNALSSYVHDVKMLAQYVNG